jgi:hypothetical protein
MRDDWRRPTQLPEMIASSRVRERYCIKIPLSLGAVPERTTAKMLIMIANVVAIQKLGRGM